MQFGFKHFINQRPAVHVNAFNDPAGQVAKNDSISPDSQPIITLQSFAQRPNVASFQSQLHQCPLYRAPISRAEPRVKIPDLFANFDPVTQSSNSFTS